MLSSKAPQLVSYDQIAPRLPHLISRRQMVRMSGHRFPAFVRPAGFKSEPLWLEQSVVAWITDTYSALLPRYCASLELAGMSAPPFSHMNAFESDGVHPARACASTTSE